MSLVPEAPALNSGWLCPRCDRVNAPGIVQCGCAATSERTFTIGDNSGVWCAFDGLPPGVYGLVCFCPKCSPRCSVLA